MEAVQLSIIDLELLEIVKTNGIVCLYASKECENLYTKYGYKSREIAFRKMSQALKKMWEAGLISRKIVGISYFQGLLDTRAKKSYYYYKRG